MNLEQKKCSINIARIKIIKVWKNFKQDTNEKRLFAKIAGILTHIIYGMGKKHHLTELRKISNLIKISLSDKYIDKSSEIPLLKTGISIIEDIYTNQKDLLISHITEKKCKYNNCFKKISPPCEKSCPAGIDIPAFIVQTGGGKFKHALEIILENNPFPYVCGLICPAPCEDSCLRKTLDKPVFIRSIKAVAARETIQEKCYPKPNIKSLTGKKVAIIGSGPGGLSAAFYLAKQGHLPVVFEAEKELGGMLRYGIPDFRLPLKILNNDISWIKLHGVEIHTKTRINNIKKLFNNGFNAVFLATGTPFSNKIPFKGNERSNVISGIDFLRKINKGENPDIGKKVIVIGGGNVAVDVAMAALRQNALKIKMVCLENKNEMPASENELRTAIMEGVIVYNSWGPFYLKKNNLFEFIFCKKIFNDKGKFAPVFDNNKKLELYCDTVLVAAGQIPDFSYLENDTEINIFKGLIKINNSYKTNINGVFAGGDVVTGPNIAVNAIKAGKEAALEIDKWLMNKNKKKHNQTEKNLNFPEKIPCLKINALNRKNTKRAKLEEQNPKKRINNYLPIEEELSINQAQKEAQRCLRCDICIGCGLCQFICSEIGINAINLTICDDRFVFTDFTSFSNKCISCGACEKVCPTGAVKIIQKQNFIRTEFTGTFLNKNTMLECDLCGKLIMPDLYYKNIETRLDLKTKTFAIKPEAIELKSETPDIRKKTIDIKNLSENLRVCPACTRTKYAENLKKFL